jgi:hypothetical protein
MTLCLVRHYKPTDIPLTVESESRGFTHNLKNTDGDKSLFIFSTTELKSQELSFHVELRPGHEPRLFIKSIKGLPPSSSMVLSSLHES